MMSFVKSTASSANNKLYYIQGIDAAGREAFYYLMVDKLKKQLFLHDSTLQKMDLRHYGKILISGFGTMPSEASLSFLKNEHGLDGALQVFE
jgi:hypothetical protein